MPEPTVVIRECESGLARILLLFAAKERIPPAGYCHIEQEWGKYWFAVWVHEAYRHRGFGRKLLTLACAYADMRNIKLSLTSKPHLVEWYESAGFARAEPHPEGSVKMSDGQTYMERVPNQ